METSNPRWSDLPPDLVISIFNRLSFTDFHRAKIVSSNWYSSSKLTVPRKFTSPWLLLFPEEDGSVLLFNPEEEDKIYRSKRDFSRIRFLSSSGNLFLVVDSKSNLSIIDVFSDNRIDLPPLESIQSSENCTLKRLGDEKFQAVIRGREAENITLITDDLKGLLWVDEKTNDYVVVWFFDAPANCVCFCKKGDDRYTYIPLLYGVPKYQQHISDVALRGQSLYIFTTRDYIRFIDLSGPRGFRDVSWSDLLEPPSPCRYEADGDIDCEILVVNESGELSLVECILDQTCVETRRRFRVFKKGLDQQDYIEEVYSLGEEALLLGLHITVPGIEPNSIYFTSHDSPDYRVQMTMAIDICVFNLETKTLKRFSRLSNMKLKSALWFLPRT